MNKRTRELLCILLAAVFAAPTLQAQENEEKPPWFYMGPRIGVICAISSRDDFDAIIQEMLPSERDYFPLFSQIGLNFEQRIRLEKNGYLAFEELFLVRGLDQNIAIPAAALLISLKLPFGLKFGLGPEIYLRGLNSTPLFSPSLVYTVGWIFSFRSIEVPVLCVYDPLPYDRKMRISLLTGFDFGLKFKFKPKEKKTPFNY
jgi:hypothetical protein